MRIDVKVDVDQALRKLTALEREIAPKAAVSALNKVATSARAEAVRQIARETGIKQSEIRQHLVIRRATRNTLSAQISAKPWSPNLIRYQARQTKQGVSAAPWRNRRVHKGTFIANQGRTVFAREGKARLPLKPIRGPSVPREFMRDVAMRAMRAKVAERFPIEFERALAQYMRPRK